MSHGAHAGDFFKSLVPQLHDISNYHNEPILFLYESPGGCCPLYEEVRFKDYLKRPTGEWFWGPHK